MGLGKDQATVTPQAISKWFKELREYIQAMDSSLLPLLFIQSGSGVSGGDDAPGGSGGGEPGFFFKIVRKLPPRKKMEAKEEEKTPVLTNAERCRQYREI